MRARGLADLLVLTSLAAVYLIAGKFGLMLAFVNTSASAVWPASGIALAALLILGYRVWPGIFLGAFLVNYSTNHSAAGLVASIGISVGNTLEGLVGAYLVTRLANGQNAFNRAHNVFKFMVLAGMVSTTVSATIGVTVLCMESLADWADYRIIWLTWWLGDLGGVLLVTPLLILWNSDPRVSWTRVRVLEGVLLSLCLLLVGQVVFGRWLLTGVNAYPLTFLCMPVLMWAAFRFSQRETATAACMLSGVAVLNTLQGIGPFVRETQNESLLLLHAFMDVTSIIALAIAAIVSERESLTLRLQDALDRVKTLRGLLPICAACKKIRANHDYWEQIETYVQRYSEAQFTHGFCPECLDRLYPNSAQATSRSHVDRPVPSP